MVLMLYLVGLTLLGGLLMIGGKLAGILNELKRIADLLEKLVHEKTDDGK